jgi:hypothetical protein
MAKNIPDVGCVESHFLDSGSFTLWTKAAEYAKKNNCPDPYAFYTTPEFYAYCDAYAEFIKKYSAGIDLYANVDAIPNPDITWRNQQYLEKLGLTPVPVVHYRTSMKWLKHYMNRGHEVIALGGMVGSTSQEECRRWIDEAFDTVCDQKSRLPKVKIHGFGVTTYDLLLRYPWYSVDSTSWTKIGAFGGILVPHKRAGAWVFDVAPYIMKTSNDSPSKEVRGQHVSTLSTAEQKIVRQWLKEIKVPLGQFDTDGTTVLKDGVLTHHSHRKVANLHFFERMRASLPAYPWPFRITSRKGFWEAD